MDEKNKYLLKLLQQNARESISSLARKLNLSRTAVQERIHKLENQGIIAGYTVKLNTEYEKRQIKAWVTMRTKQKLNRQVVAELSKIEEITSLRTVSGVYDLIATVLADSTDAMDDVLDRMGTTTGVEKTQSSIVLSIKFER
ncbi:MAG: DNA-binding Lrp family transcriptional regulator [Phenylobacterium sp.]